MIVLRHFRTDEGGALFLLQHLLAMDILAKEGIADRSSGCSIYPRTGAGW